MLLFSSALRHVVYPSLAAAGYFRGWREKQINQLSILTYHGVFPEGYSRRSLLLDGNLISAGRLRDQLRLLKRHYHVISPEEFLGLFHGEFQLPSRAVLLTCDDGLSNVVSEMLPVLESLELKCIFFITGASSGSDPGMLWYEELWLLLDAVKMNALQFEYSGIVIHEIPFKAQDRHRLWWKLVRELSRVSLAERKEFMHALRETANLSSYWLEEIMENAVQRSRFQLLDRHGVEKLLQSGMAVGAHTMSHPVLSECNRDAATHEIGMVNGMWPANWNVKMLAYPFGTPETAGLREALLAEAAGYQCGLMNVGGCFSSTASRFAVPRINITDRMGVAEFEAWASGFHPHLQERWRRPANIELERTAL